MQKNPDMNELLRFAQSQVGRELISALQRSGGQQLQSALSHAATGNYEEAKKLLSPLLNSPEIQKLVTQLEDGK